MMLNAMSVEVAATSGHCYHREESGTSSGCVSHDLDIDDSLTMLELQMKDGGSCRWGGIPCMAGELMLQVEALEREWPSSCQDEDDDEAMGEGEGEEVACCVGCLDMVGLSSVVASGVGFSGALATAREGRGCEGRSAFRQRNCAAPPSSQPTVTFDAPISKLALFPGATGELGTGTAIEAVWEPALCNWRAVQRGQGPTVAGAWRGCGKGAKCNREPRHRGVCNTRASPPSLADLSDVQLAAAPLSPEERTQLAAATQQEDEVLALPTDSAALQAAVNPSLLTAQNEEPFLPFEGDESDDSEYTGLALKALSADSDLDMSEALDCVSDQLAGDLKLRHQPLGGGVLALRAWGPDDWDVSSAYLISARYCPSQLGSFTSTPAVLALEPAVTLELDAALNMAPTRNSRRLQAKVAASRLWRSPSPEEEDVPQPLRTSLRRQAVPADADLSRAASPAGSATAPTSLRIYETTEYVPPVVVPGAELGVPEPNTQRVKMVLGNRNRKRSANGSLKGAFSSIAPAAPGQHCAHCGTNVTPVWRAGPNGPKTLCNACGVRWMKVKPRQPQLDTSCTGRLLE